MSYLTARLYTMIICPNDDRLTREFLYLLCGTETFTEHTYAHTTGTTVLHLAKGAVLTSQAAVPSLQVARAFTKVAKSAFMSIHGVEQEKEVLSALRDTLLPKLISGELRVQQGLKRMENEI